MSTMGFCHLQTRLHQCLRGGGCISQRLVQRVAELDMPAVAVANPGGMYGVVNFAQLCLDAGIKPIFGLQVRPVATPGPAWDGEQGLVAPPLVLLATNLEGYESLVALASTCAGQPDVGIEVLAAHSKGLIGLTGVIGEDADYRKCVLAQAVVRAHVGQLCDIYGVPNMYLMVSNHGLPEQALARQIALQIASETAVPLVATNDCRYVEPADAETYDVWSRLWSGYDPEHRVERRLDWGQLYVKTGEEMLALFGEVPEAVARTSEVVARCNVDLPWGAAHPPRVDIPPNTTPSAYLRHLCELGLVRRYGRPEKRVQKRLRDELQAVATCGRVEQFLVAAALVSEATSRGIILGPGYGDMGASIVGYALGLTEVDPIALDLPFEDLLNPELPTGAVVGLQLPADRRDETAVHLRSVVGSANTARVTTYHTASAQTAVRAAGRLLGTPPEQTGWALDRIPGGRSLRSTLETVPELAQAATAGELGAALACAGRLEGGALAQDVDCEAAIVSDEALGKLVPLSELDGHSRVAHYTLPELAALGFGSINLCALRTLSVVDAAQAAIRAGGDPGFDIGRIPRDDPRTYGLLASADTLGVYQMEAEGLRSCLPRLRPTCLEHLRALLALYRRSLFAFVDQYCAGRHGAELVVAHHSLEPILAETHGVLIYREQAASVMAELAGFGVNKAYALVAAMQTRDEQRAVAVERAFREACECRGLPAGAVDRTWHQMAAFAESGTSKAEAASSALLSYRTAWLKANYPNEFRGAHREVWGDGGVCGGLPEVGGHWEESS